MNNKWAEQFARFEALLSRGNVFSTPKTTVNPVTSKVVLSDSPFIPLAARPTGPVETPAVQGVVSKSGQGKPKKSKDKKQKKSAKSSDKSVQLDQPVHALTTSGPENVVQVPAHKKTAKLAPSVSLQQEDLQTGAAGESTFDKPSSSVLSDPSVAGAFAMPSEPDEVDFDHPFPVLIPLLIILISTKVKHLQTLQNGLIKLRK